MMKLNVVFLFFTFFFFWYYVTLLCELMLTPVAVAVSNVAVVAAVVGVLSWGMY